ncbi:MAG: bifunctional YncE family protein/alkaline phosphatase family protein [Gemmataceae bacterium]|nr:bifunctional YncE family protein/alkaline phosphatase family protein [Gemmataceae bacterium]
MRIPRTAAAALLLGLVPLIPADEIDKLKVGQQPDGRIVVPTNQILKPAGKQVIFPGRPVALALIDDGKTLAVQNKTGLVFIDVGAARVKQTLTSKVGLSVVGLVAAGDRICTSDAKDHVRVAVRKGKGAYAWDKTIPLKTPAVGGAAHPAGMALRTPGELWVCSTRGNNVQRIDLKKGAVAETVGVGVAPFAICFPRDDRAYVSNWGGNPPKKDDPQAPSSKTPVRIDPRTGVANHGSVSVLARTDGGWKQVKTIDVGLHPSGLAISPEGRFVYVANANSDTVSVIDTRTDKVVETIFCRSAHRLPFGSGTNALALSPDGGTLYAANGTNNCVAVVALAGGSSDGRQTEARPRASMLLGLIPTGWYPGGVVATANRLFVANVKGHGSLDEKRAKEKGKNSHDHLGSVSLIDIPSAEKLAGYTKEVNANNRLTYSLAGLERPRPGVKPVPVPQRHGEPSVFKHVIYVIRENRTYDQVFGDLKEGNGDPNLVMFGEKVTPNAHALARQFTLFDNFYCSGVLSADGHSWVNEAYVTDYLERAFGGFTRSYPYEGSDALAFAPTGFLWDNALVNKKTFRNYGEFCRTVYTPAKPSWTELYRDFKNGTRKVKVEGKPNMHTLNDYSHPGYPGFSMVMPDVYRAKLFLDEFKEFERKGDFPNLVYLFLPCDHTSGTRPDAPTPRAMVADNDLALGRVVEAVSKSKFWRDTCIFVVEDDPQNGFDHVDGHRTIALVISPYTKRKFVDHTNYNQTGMVKTIELILGLPPMNQLDLSATPMRACFQEQPDLTPYTHLPNQVPLDEMNPPLKKLKGQALSWAKKSLELNLDDVDAADEDTFNRILWHATRGDLPYPAQFVGRRAPGRE